MKSYLLLRCPQITNVSSSFLSQLGGFKHAGSTSRILSASVNRWTQLIIKLSSLLPLSLVYKICDLRTVSP